VTGLVPERGLGASLPVAGHVALVQPRVGIGDMVWHLPHLRAVARRVVGRVTLVARPRSRADQLVGAADGIDEVFWVERDQWTPGGRHQGVSGWLRLTAEIRARRFDAALLLTRSRALTLAFAAAGVPARWGYGFGSQRALLNRPPYLPERARALHPYDQATAWLNATGLTLAEPEPRLHVAGEVRGRVRARLGAGTGPLIALGIAASDAWKQWPAPRFAELASALLGAGWERVVLIGGEAERVAADAILGCLGESAARVVPVLGWDLREVAALVEDAALYVGNDTAVLNIAAAVGTRAYGLFGATPVLLHSPNIVAVVPPGGPDRDAGMGRITVAAVLDVIERDRGGLAPGAVRAATPRASGAGGTPASRA
jgi:heptosyltransferase II